MKLFSLLFLVLGVTSIGHAAVWTSTQTWNEQSENNFASFIDNKVSPDIFSNPRSAYYGISTDCAEAIYSLRVIFAYENHLPFAMKDPSGNGGMITSDMNRWDHLPEGARLRHFIDFVKDTGNSQTLPEDTYPVAINKDYVTPGTVFLNTVLGGIPGLSNSGHAEYVQKIEDTGYLVFMSSTVPQAVRKLNVTLVETLVPQNTNSGFRRFKQPAFYKMSESSLPGYSLEQFRLGQWTPGMSSRSEIFGWHEAIRNRIRARPATLDESMHYLTTNVCTLLQARVALVNAGWKALQAQGDRCTDPQSSTYDDYSTPERDTRILDNYSLLEELLKVQDPRSANEQLLDQLRQHPGAGGSPITPTVKYEVYDMGKARQLLEDCKIEYLPGEVLTAFQLYSITKSGHLDSDPNDRVKVRWGVEIPTRRYEDCR